MNDLKESSSVVPKEHKPDWQESVTGESEDKRVKVPLGAALPREKWTDK